MPLYSSFIEGFGAPDLIDAEALLNELRQSRGDLICDMPNGSSFQRGERSSSPCGNRTR
jgi:hypothetical protein